MYVKHPYLLYPHKALGEYVQKQYILIKDRMYERYRDMRTGAFITKKYYNLMKGIIRYHNKLNAFRRAHPELTYTEARKELHELYEKIEIGLIDKETFIREISP